ncbi:MAG: hypothetical protein JXB62_12435 [Pirellulales bacterium]|nr:hypothetical protein [Pirellulales bacterium]
MRNPLGIVWLLVAVMPTQSRAAELKVLLPQGRAAYQTNERIAVSVVRSDTEPLPATDLTMTVSGEDDSQLVFAFPLAAVAAEGDLARTTDHLSLNGRLLRPGKYTIEVAAHGAVSHDAAARTEIEVYSHLRKSSYRIVHWGSPATSEQQAMMGEDGLGYNLLMNSRPPSDNMVRAGLDFMGSCLMGGMHQHDGRIECDWSDPYVTGGAVQRAMVRAYPYRTWGNMIGAHLHDEPGLTYAKHAHTGQFVPYDVPQQRAAYRRIFGEEPVWYDEVRPDQPESLARWTAVNDFRLGFMEAFWRQARFALEKMKPGYLSVTQSQYAWWALFQSHKAFTIVRGSGEEVTVAARCLAESLEPYDVHCTIMEAADVKTRQLTESEKKTWTSYGGGAGDTPLANGFDLPGPAILIGNAQNNPVLAAVAQPKKWHPEMPSLMPYEPDELVPGPGRAMIGWHMYPIGRRLETVSLLANDARGLREAVGTLMEVVAGLQPLTPLAQPSRSNIVAANKALPKPPEADLAWQCALPDRAVSIDTQGDRVVVSTLDGSSTTIDVQGNIVSRKAAIAARIETPPAVNLDALPKEAMLAGRIAKWTAAGAQATAVGYWGGTLQVFDKAGNVRARQQLPQDVAGMAWHDEKLIVGLADGRLLALRIASPVSGE